MKANDIFFMAVLQELGIGRTSGRPIGNKFFQLIKRKSGPCLSFVALGTLVRVLEGVEDALRFATSFAFDHDVHRIRKSQIPTLYKDVRKAKLGTRARCVLQRCVLLDINKLKCLSNKDMFCKSCSCDRPGVDGVALSCRFPG